MAWEFEVLVDAPEVDGKVVEDDGNQDGVRLQQKGVVEEAGWSSPVSSAQKL